MNILILEDEPRNAKRLIRLLSDIDRTFIVEGPLASIKDIQVQQFRLSLETIGPG